MRTFKSFREDEIKDLFFVYNESRGKDKEKIEDFKQHNVMALVGNGFDTAIMNEIGKAHTTSYSNFYNYIKYEVDDIPETNLIMERVRKKMKGQEVPDLEDVIKEIIDIYIPYINIDEAEAVYVCQGNKYIRKIKEKKDDSFTPCNIDGVLDRIRKTLSDSLVRSGKTKVGESDQKDFDSLWEKEINEIIEGVKTYESQNSGTNLLERVSMGYLEKRHHEIARKIKNDINEISNEMSKYLNDIVTYDVLYKINNRFQNKLLGYQSMSSFEEDVDSDDYKGVQSFISNVKEKKYSLYNYLFVDFSYTQLLDDYLCLDRDSNGGHTHVDTNFAFIGYTNPGYVMYELIHPHGYQNVPRSILFGPDWEWNKEHSLPAIRDRFTKSYIAQYERFYSDYFKHTEMFILFGMSLSHSDGWWVNRIMDEIILSHKKKENKGIVIYYFLKDYSNKKIEETRLKEQSDHLWNDVIIPEMNENEDTRSIVEDYLNGKQAKGNIPENTLKDVLKIGLIKRFIRVCLIYENPNIEKEELCDEIDDKYQTISQHASVVLFTKNTTAFLGFTPIYEKETDPLDTKRSYPQNGTGYENYVWERDEEEAKISVCNEEVYVERKKIGKIVGNRHDYIC